MQTPPAIQRRVFLQAPQSRRGFALLITITLVAFLVLILVALATFTRVETQVASNAQKANLARQNALMALNIALGQLQAAAGPDQRVTAIADLAGDKDGRQLAAGGTAQNCYGVPATDGSRGAIPNGLVGPQAGTRYWTGVWGNSDAPAGIFTKTPAPVLLNWLVSGNEGTTFKFGLATGQITDNNGGAILSGGAIPSGVGVASNTIAPVFNPSLAVSALSTSSASAALDTPTITAGVNARRAKILVGPSTVGSDTSKYVVAPLVDINAAAGAVPGLNKDAPIGRYAWWVGDEGVKARYNIVDPYSSKTDPASQLEARYRLTTPSHTGVELLSSALAAKYPVPTSTNHVQLAKILQFSQLGFLSPGVAVAEFQSRFHTLSTVGAGLLTDTQNGGLRHDLSYSLGQPTLGATLYGEKIIPKIGAVDYSPATGPKWDQLYSFYNTPVTGSGATASVVIRPQTANQMGITPVITQFRFLISQSSAPADTSCKLRANILCVLSNPYNVTLNAPASGADLFFFNPHQTSENDLGIIGICRSAPAASSGSVSLLPTIGTATTTNQGTDIWTNVYYGVSRSRLSLSNPSVATDRTRGLLDTVRFHIDSFSIPPGQSIILSVKGTSQTVSASAPRGTSLIAPTPNTINLEVGYLPSSGVFSSNYYEANEPLVLPTGCTMQYTRLGLEETWSEPSTSSNSQKVDYAIQLRVGDSSGAGELLQEVSQGDLLAPTQRDVGPSDFAPIGQTVVALYSFAFRPPGDRFYTSGIGQVWDYRIYQDFNIRAVSLDRPNILNLYAQVPCFNSFSTVDGATATNSFNTVTPVGSSPLWSEDLGSSGFASPKRSGPAARGVLFDLPRSDLPLFSLAQLQHASLTADSETGNNAVEGSQEHINHRFGGVYQQPGYAVANSYSHPFLPRANVKYTTTLKGLGIAETIKQTTFFDISYLLNTALWDSYYFSSIPQSGAALKPLNPRYQLLTDQATAAQLRQPDSAQHLLVNGAFNVNSTDPEAWKALLGGLNNINTPTDSATGTVFARSIWQPGASANTKTGTGDDAYTGVRRLSAAELDSLAQAIVQRVRARGPFVSLAHFINRTLITASTDFNPVIRDASLSNGSLATAPSGTPAFPMGRGFSGPLQSAIDSAGQTANSVSPIIKTVTLAGGLNDFGGGSGSVTPCAANAYGDRILYLEKPSVNPVFPDTSGPGGTSIDSLYGWNGSTITGGASIGGAYAPGPQGRKSTGIPGWLMQGDVLQSIGSVLSARSDTFVVRAYGEVLNPLDSTDAPLARAWCEAVVQRFSDFVDTSDKAKTAPATLNTTNQMFGRRFKIISFRWLSPDDI